MKTPSEALYQLVHSLGQNEKRYFMVQAKGAARSYLELFRLINAQAGVGYDEAEIRKKMNMKDAFVFKKLKNYTFQSILKSLEGYFGNSSDEIIVMRKMIQSEILFDKKLFAHSIKNVKAALQLAEEKDLLFFIPACYERLYKLGVASARPQDSLKEIDTKKVGQAVADCGRWLRLKHLNTLFWNYIHTSGEVATPEELKLLCSIIKDTHKLFAEGPAGYTIKRESYLLLGLAYRFNKQGEQSLIYRKKLVELIESEKKYLYERRHEYISALGNLMNMCRDLNKDDEMINAFEKASDFMRSIPKRQYDFRLDETYCNLKNGYVSFLFYRKEYAETIRYAEELLKRIKVHGGNFENSLMSILYQSLMYSHFFLGDMRSALRYHHLHLKRHEKNDVSRLLFGLVIVFEMGDMDALHYKCRSLLYYLQKKKKHEPEALLARAFNNLLVKKAGKKGMQSDFSKLYSAMNVYRKEYAEMLKDYKFDYPQWVKNKAEGVKTS